MRKWQKLNPHNSTIAMNRFPIEKVTVGKYTYGPLNIISFENDKEKVQIGSFCSIAENVKFLMSGGHEYSGLSTYPFKKLVLRNDIIESTTKGPIVVCDDVWIGYGALILSGVTIGQGAIIGAGSVVAKDVPPYSIYVGNKIIKYRFADDIIEKLKKFDYSNINVTEIKENIELIYSEMSSDFFMNTFYNNHIKVKDVGKF
jgi:acetyltransferase-like isoleucine patch superfamily enzyme